MKILDEGYEIAVRSKLGIDELDLPNEEINQPLIAQLAEEVVAKRVPNYVLITDTSEWLFLQNAAVSYICYLLAPSMPQRINIEASTIDNKWKKSKTDWDKRADSLLNEFETSLNNVGSVEVVGYDIVLMGIASNTRNPIGGEG